MIPIKNPEPVSIAWTEPRRLARRRPKDRRARRTASGRDVFCVERAFASGCGMNWRARRSQVASECPDAECCGRATVERVVEAQVLPQQDDECAQLGSLASRWPSGSGPGTVDSRQRDVRQLEQANAQGWTENPNRDNTWHSGFSRLRVCTTLRVREIRR